VIDSAAAGVATRRADVVVIGDGPAGSALAAACLCRDIDVILVGADRPWRAIYGVWVDEVADVEVLGGSDIFAARLDSIRAYGNRRHDLIRPYGVIDNAALRAVLRSGVDVLSGSVQSVRIGVTHHSVLLVDESRIRCRLIVDATGGIAHVEARGRGPAWQTAAGVVLAEPPEGDLGIPTLMDLRPSVGDVGNARTGSTFAYSLPVVDGWLVEETVLAARPAVEPPFDRLAARLGRSRDALLAGAVRTEIVKIPMGGRIPDRRRPIVNFGASAGYIHPATGFSVAASLRATSRVADAIGEALDSAHDLAADARLVWDAVWPAGARRTRVLHDYGLERIIRFDDEQRREFFDRFFELSVDEWAGYLRIDTPPAVVSRTMRRLFRSAGWPMRRRLASGNPLPLVRLLRP
jgi:lycopene beta-cyclase